MYQVNTAATQVNILPEQLLLDYFETMSRVPLSQQVGGACTYITQRCNVDHGNYDIRM